MTSESKVYIAGVGFSPLPSGGSPVKASIASLVSAATKALLDAGVTYGDVTRIVTITKGSTSSELSKAFGDEGVPVDEVENESEFDASFHSVRDRGARCVLMIAVEKSAAVAFVLVSDTFIWSHPYLKDSAALVRKSDNSPGGEAKQGLYDICQMVWALRGWTNPGTTAGKEGRLRFKGKSSQTFELTRADAKAVPEWKEVEHKQDGKHRLGYNPAAETKDISHEDFEAVRASGKSKKEEDNSIQFICKGGDRAALAKL